MSLTNILSITLKAALAAAAITISTDALAWGQKGHDVTCAIAQNHLSKKAQKKVDEIFEGKSLVYWANWMDNASHTKEYSYTSTWHYKNIDADQDYDTAPTASSGDVLTAIESQAAALKSGTLNAEQQAVALRMLIHFVGDLHCPMHVSHKSDQGGNRWQVQFFDRGSNLHKIWDSEVLESGHNWTYTEWAEEIDCIGKKEEAGILKGTPSDWGRETFAISTRIYDTTPVGAKLSYDYVSEWTPVVERQLLAGGLRLAKILNEIFK